MGGDIGRGNHRASMFRCEGCGEEVGVLILERFLIHKNRLFLCWRTAASA
jgi:hypothetical protein